MPISPRSMRLALSQQGHWAWVTILVLTAGIELVLFCADQSWLGDPRWRPMAYAMGAVWPEAYPTGPLLFGVQRLTMPLSYGLLHTGMGHMIGNMAVLAWLGWILAPLCGAGRFLLLYTGSLLGGSLVFIALAVTPQPMVGASGALMGLMAAWIILDAQEMRRIGEEGVLSLFVQRIAVVTGLNVLMYILAEGHIAWQTHLGGFLSGAGIALILCRR